jgi:translation initiation factor IF-3
VAVQFRGRELTHAYLGRDLLLRFADLIKEHGAVERQPLLEGKSMSIVVTSTHKPKTQSAPGTDGAERPATPAAQSRAATGAGARAASRGRSDTATAAAGKGE